MDSKIMEQIRQRAYEFYLQRGRVHGHDREDWLAAEKEITQQSQKSPTVAPAVKPETKKSTRKLQPV